MQTYKMEINLFGPCIVRSKGEISYEITGTKHKALFAILATAPFGRRTRSFLQDTLWGTSTFDSGRQSLRRAMSDIKGIMGPEFAELISTSHSEISLNLEHVLFLGRPGGATFLEGLDIREEGFNAWVSGIRQNPGQLFSLFSVSHQPPPKSLLPMVAVIPFRNMAVGPPFDILGDWVAEEICRSLSRSNLMGVISHLSARRFGRAVISIEDVRRDLGVDYCLTGSLRVEDTTAILDADLIDVSSGRILSTRTLRAGVAEFMAADSAPIADLTNVVGRSIAADTVYHARGRALKDLEDHRLLLAGIGMMHELRLSSFARSRQLIEEAMSRAPHSAEPLAWLGDWYVMSVWNGWSTDPAKDADLAVECTQRALDLDPDNALCRAVDGVVQSALLNDQGAAEKQFSRALDLNPNDSMSWLFSGVMHAFRDEGRVAVSRVEKAQKLSPIDPLRYLQQSFAAYAHVSDENYAKAVALADSSLDLNSRHVSTLRTKLCAHYHLDELDQMHATAALLRDLMPEFALDAYRRSHPATEFAVGDRMTRALRAAGF